MKRERQIVEQRRSNILKYLKSNKGISLEELAKILEVSKITINRDLNELEKAGHISRHYGGVRLNETPTFYDKTHGKDENYLKEQIARYASQFIEENDVIFINSSYTALSILKYISNKRITVVTNNANAFNIPHSHLVTIILTGGELREAKGVMVGDFAISNLKRISVKKCFIGCSGLSKELGVTTENLNEVNINELMLSKSPENVFVLADKTKIGATSSFVSCPISTVKNIITNENLSSDKIEILKKLNINIILAPNT